MYVSVCLCLLHRPPYLTRLAPPYSLAPTDPPVLSYKGTVAWKAIPVRVSAKARISAEFLDVQLKASLATPDAVVTKLQVVVDVPVGVLGGRSVTKCVSKPVGAQWRGEKNQLGWALATLGAGDEGTLATRLYLSPAEGGAPEAGVQFADLRVQCMYTYSGTATECSVDVAGCAPASLTQSVLVKCLFLPNVT